jgi:hypothetical protein
MQADSHRAVKLKCPGIFLNVSSACCLIVEADDIRADNRAAGWNEPELSLTCDSKYIKARA